jgi:hypothetical protein
MSKDSEGKRVEIGHGDNVLRHPSNIEGQILAISDADQVMEFLTQGIPKGKIILIDDSGGTLTAPLIEDFQAILCLGGTTRSHLGILAREFKIPCLMNVILGETERLKNDDWVEVEYSAPARTAASYHGKGEAITAHIWKIEKEG